MIGKFCAAVCLLGLLSAPCGAAESSELRFDPESFTLKTLRVEDLEVSFRTYTDVLYVARPVDDKYQRMNLYIPEAYFEGGDR